MGMFDYIRCEYPLPDGLDPKAALTCQSKDFGCDMHVYTITPDGRLLHEDSGSAWVPDPKPWPVREVPFHGWLTFYTSTGDINNRDEATSDYRWWEYRAKFTDGRLVEIRSEPHNQGTSK